jgi:hypothetical protein
MAIALAEPHFMFHNETGFPGCCQQAVGSIGNGRHRE